METLEKISLPEDWYRYVYDVRDAVERRADNQACAIPQVFSTDGVSSTS